MIGEKNKNYQMLSKIFRNTVYIDKVLSSKNLEIKNWKY